MATINFGDPTVTTFTLDETAGLQNATATPTPAGDANDEDISRTTLQSSAAAFDTLLFTTMGLSATFPAGGRIAQSTSNFLVASDGSITSISLAGEFNSGTGTATPLVAYDGTNFAAGGLTGLTTITGEAIHLFSDVNGAAAGAGLTGSVAFGVDSSGDIVFAIYMKTTAGTGGQVNIQFSMVTFEAFQHGDTTTADEFVDLNDFLSLVVQTQSGFDFTGVPPGKSMFLMAPALSGTGGVLVTPLTEVVEINTSNADPAGVIGFGSQGINAGETVAVTWIKDGLDSTVTIPNLDQNEADVATNIKFGNLDSVKKASFEIMQKVGSQTAAVTITALDTNVEDGTGSGNFFDNVGNATLGGAGDDTIVSITSVTLTRGTTSVKLTADGNFTGIAGASADFLATGRVTITGLEAGDVITYETTLDHERLLVTGVSGNVDIGAFSSFQSGSTTVPIGDFFQIEDDGPTAPTLAALTSVTHDETAGVQSGTSTSNPNAQDDIAGSGLPAGVLALFNAIGAERGSDPGVATKDNGAIGFAKGAGALVSLTGGGFGTDGAANSGSVVYALSVSNGTFSGLSTTEGTQIFLYNGTGALAGLILGRVGIEAGTTDTADPAGIVAYALAIDSSGTGYTAQYLSVNHGTGGSTPAAYDNEVAIIASAVQATVTYTDRDGDSSPSTPANVGNLFKFQDDGPRITVAPPSSGSPLVLDNSATPLPISNTGNFGYDLGSDDRTTYSSSSSDFVDSNGGVAGIQLALSGEVGTGANKTIANTSVSLTGSETTSAATFNFSFDYDTDPATSGVQTATATGTLSFDKVNDTFTVSLNNAIQGFNFDVLHTSELLEKNPTSNNGHPPLVVQKLAEDFFVQFTADTDPFGFSATGQGTSNDNTFNAGDLAGGTETWVSATQSTNGVAGDTIQKNELLTLRFFGTDILSDATPPVTEQTDPTATADGIAVKFDGIGANEDLIIILNLTNGTTETTRAIIVENADIFKKSTPGGVPAPYNTEFTLDNNDGLVIIESNDYNAAGETFKIQGIQIMQSANGLTGSGIDLVKTTGSGGGSDTTITQSFTSGNTNDVLKITDIGFIRTETGTQDAHLDFSFQLVDADGDLTAVQHLFVDVLNP